MLTAERQYISRYATDVLGFTISVAGVPTDADDNEVVVSFINEETQSTIAVREADRVAIGEYRIQLTSQETAQPGEYRIRWDYSLDGIAQIFDTYATVGQSEPTYDALAPGMKEVVDQVWVRFADLYDSPAGGAHLQVYFQTHFSRNRVAQLLRVAVGKLNTMAQPHQSYTIDDGQGGALFPVLAWGPLLEQSLYVEVIKHLRRSYVEQPAIMNEGVARTDRRDYLDRWGLILEDEEETLKQQLGVFKISNMGLGRPAVLTSGGVYGRFAPTRYAGNAAARGRLWARMY